MNYHPTKYNGQPLYQRADPDTPLMIMMCGLPGSGKSTYAESILVATPADDEFDLLSHPAIHSSDALRKEMFGDEATQGDNQRLFDELHRRIKTDLSDGKDVVYDATNIKKKERIEFLKSLSKIRCFPICIVSVASIGMCHVHNRFRARNVPEGVIDRMFRNWTPPHYSEGFEYIDYVFDKTDCLFTVNDYMICADQFDQKNSHHSLSLGEHSRKAAEYVFNHNPNNFNLLMAAILHDNGKLYTRSVTNAKGEDDGDCHYYQHQNCGAYYSLIYLNGDGGYTNEDMAYISNIIYYHMHPYLQWKQSERVVKRDKVLLGEEMFNDVMLLHEGDKYAH